ncbi:MAG: alkaline phosphatase D family protein [Ignavibacteriaceae bacterium]
MGNNQIILGPIIGMVSDKKAKVWFYGSCEDDPYCHVFNNTDMEPISGTPFKFNEVSVSGYEKNGMTAKAYVAEVLFPPNMKELTRCLFRINFSQDPHFEDEKIYSIQQSPDQDELIKKFSFSLISCNFGFVSTDTNKKNVVEMWANLYNCMKDNDCKFLIQAGDQVYCDLKRHNAWGKSKEELKKWKKEKDKNKKDEYIQNMLNNYRDIYLDSWGFPEVQHVMQTFPQYMIWDDHEISNGWGSSMDHENYSKIFDAARKAYVEFQHSHNPDSLKTGELYYAFSYGPASFLVMDIRGHRDFYRKQYTIAGKEQWDRIQKWINSKPVKNSKILFVVTSVPVLHISRKFGSLGFIKSDLRDQWSTGNNKHERRKLLNMLFDWSGENKRPVFILGGDVHVGTVIKLEMIDKAGNPIGKKIDQITSSPITMGPAWFLDFIMAFMTRRFKFHLDDKKQVLVQSKVRKRFRRRNFGIIEVNLDKEMPEVKLKMYTQGKTEPEVVEFE